MGAKPSIKAECPPVFVGGSRFGRAVSTERRPLGVAGACGEIVRAVEALTSCRSIAQDDAEPGKIRGTTGRQDRQKTLTGQLWGSFFVRIRPTIPISPQGGDLRSLRRKSGAMLVSGVLWYARGRENATWPAKLKDLGDV